MLVKKPTEPTEAITKSCALVQKQIEHELDNERLYLAMASWLDYNGCTQSAQFFFDHACEEKKHAVDFINHSLMRNVHAQIPGTKPVKTDYKDLTELLEFALQREIETTALIQTLFTVGQEEDSLLIDIALKYIKEQKEEEQLFISLLDLWKICDGSKIDFEMEVMKLKTDCLYKKGNL